MTDMASAVQLKQAVERRNEDFLFIDCRDESKFMHGNVGGNRMTEGEMMSNLPKMAQWKDKFVIVGCAMAHSEKRPSARVESACSALRGAGFEKVFGLEGGIWNYENIGGGKIPKRDIS